MKTHNTLQWLNLLFFVVVTSITVISVTATGTYSSPVIKSQNPITGSAITVHQDTTEIKSNNRKVNIEDRRVTNK